MATATTATLTAGEIIDRVKANLGAPWRDATYRDTFKFGGPDTKVTGIATTAFASLDVIQRAVKAGLNMIVPHEVTWWNDRDDTTIVQDDAVYKEKVEFMRKHDVVVFRMHDHMHVQRPDFTYVGSARTLGLDSKDETAPNSHRYVIRETTLGALAADFQKRLGAKALRVVGDPNAKVRRMQLGVGYATPMISQADVDVIVSGEQQEADGGFDSPAYVVDAMTLGIAKGWIMLGHTYRKNRACSKWAAGSSRSLPEIPVELVKAEEPFWAPR